MNSRFQQQLNFILEADKLKNVIRRNYLTDDSRRENTAEHSWHSVLMAQILFEHADNKEELDLLHILQMITVHDLVEVYAGDTFMYDEEGYKDKFERENAAAQQIFGLLPEDQYRTYYDLWLEFEDESTPNAIFAASVDRLMPVLLNTHNSGTSWREAHITGKQVHESLSIIQKSPKTFQDLLCDLVANAQKKGSLL